MPNKSWQLHWSQAKVYAYLMCLENEFQRIKDALVYCNVKSNDETLLVEELTASVLKQYFDSLYKKLINWSELELAHRASRNIDSAKLDFPHAQFQTGQRKLAESVYKTAMLEQSLLVQATTGGYLIGIE